MAQLKVTQIRSSIGAKRNQRETLRSLEEPEAVAARRGLPVEDVAPAALLRARAEVNP